MIDFDKLEDKALKIVAEKNFELEKISRFNTKKVLDALKKSQVSDFYMKPTNGYAYSDIGRDKLDDIYADIFKAEAALVRSQFVSGTHTIAVALMGILEPGDELLAVTGTPYDTLQTIIGYPIKAKRSLVDSGVTYKEIDLIKNEIDFNGIKAAINDKTKIVHIQRSCGYSSIRNSISIAEIGSICKFVKQIKPDIICFVDNCYGEFIETKEPIEVGADIIAGSLIKNIGGGLAPTGGYIVGRKDLIELASYRLVAPGLGSEMGATLGDTAKDFYQGLFLAPHVTLQALKTSIFSSIIFSELGYEVKPNSKEKRNDIIQVIRLESKERLCKFNEAIQQNSPVDAHVKPIPAELPGYQDEIIMAAGTFVQGASIELSCDGPIREPFNVYLQGGLTFEHGSIAIMSAAKLVGENK